MIQWSRAPALILCVAVGALCAGCSTTFPSDVTGLTTPATLPLQPASAVPLSAAAGLRTQAVVPGRPARVFILAAVGEACTTEPIGDLSVAVPPAKGEVSFRPGQTTRIATSSNGTCLGTRAEGTGIYYTARPGETGSDSFTVAAQLPTGETTTRQFTVQIAE